MSLTLRCSALPLAFLCPGSVRPGALSIDEVHEGGALGSAAHECLRSLPECGRIDWAGVTEVAQRHHVAEQEPELRMLLALGQNRWNELKDSFPDAVTELPVKFDGGEFELTGHIDVHGSTMDRVYILDWKTGRLDHDYSEQLKGYAALALLEDDALVEATAGIVWLRTGEWEHYTMRREELGAYLRRLKSIVVDWDGTFRAGDHCHHCPRSHECPARHALVRRDVAAFLGGELTEYACDQNALERLPAAELHALLASADLVHDIAARVRKEMRALVERKGDIVHPETGARLTLEKTQKRHLEVIPSFPVLTAHGFEDQEFAEVVDISLAKAEDVVARKAPYRGGKKAKEKLRADLEAVGAIKTEPVARLVTRRA